METKGKGKAIIGIAMAAIMLASVFAVMVPMASAAIVAERVVAASELNKDTIFIGETLNVTGINASSAVKFTKAEDPSKGHLMTMTAATNKTYAVRDITSSIVKEGKYEVEYEKGDGTLVSTMTAYFDTPTLKIEIQDEQGEEIESTTAGTNLTIAVDTNLPSDDVVKVKIQDPDGHKKTDLQGEIGDLSYAAGYLIDTTNWKSGEYTIWLETVDTEARGLDIDSEEKKAITIYKREITIEAETEEPVVAEKVLITIRAPPRRDFNFHTSHEEYVVMTDLEKDPLGLTKITTPKKEKETMDNAGKAPYNFKSGEFWAKTDEDGLYKFVVSFKDDRTFTFDVWYYENEGLPTEKKYEDDIELDVEKAEVVFDLPATVLIGEKLTIKGTITEGESVDIYIDDELESKFDDVRVTDGVFEEDWNTKGKKTGSYRIDVYIDLDGLEPDKDKLPAVVDEDGTTTVRLIEPGLSAEQPRDVIAEEDDYVVEGTATGVDEVDIVIIGPDGFDGDKFTMEKGLVFETASVNKDNLFDAEIDTGDADSGKYIVLVLVPGRDGDYGITVHEDGALESVFDDLDPVSPYKAEDYFDGKSKAQILSMITATTIDETGSDDIMVVLEFTIESPYVELDAIEDVGVGEPLIVSGTTNREDGTVIMISLTGPVETSATVEVMDCKFNVTIDTTDLTKGVYTVEADDGDGHIATGSVDVGEAAPEPTPTAEPTAEPTAAPTAVPTAEPTAEPVAEPTPTEEPGFEAAFAIAGLLSIAYLVLRRRK